MASNIDESFYMYDIGHAPSLLTLGTLVFENYKSPDVCCSFSGLIDESLVRSTKIQGRFIVKSGIEVKVGTSIPAIAEFAIGAGRQHSRVVEAEGGLRVILREPLTFFNDTVLTNVETREALARWLRIANSAYVRRKFTMRRPKIYCVTGVYELENVRSIVDFTRNASADVSIDGAVLAAAAGVPIGAHFGPFATTREQSANVFMAGKNIWAVRYHRLKVTYLKIGSAQTLPTHITMVVDRTGAAARAATSNIAEVVMLDKEADNESREDDHEYWSELGVAEQRQFDDDDDEDDFDDDEDS